MTSGEKIRTARRQAGLTQEQLAQRLNVSRAAVAKWETDAGTPDPLNLKALASMFGVSMEALLDDSVELTTFCFTEKIDLRDYPPTGRCRDAYDAAAVSRFPDAYRVCRVALLHGLNKAGRILNFFTFGLAALIWSLSHTAEFRKHYYLAETGETQYLVTVDDTSITTTPLPHRLRHADEFQIGGRTYLRTNDDLIR